MPPLFFRWHFSKLSARNMSTVPTCRPRFSTEWFVIFGEKRRRVVFFIDISLAEIRFFEVEERVLMLCYRVVQILLYVNVAICQVYPPLALTRLVTPLQCYPPSCGTRNPSAQDMSRCRATWQGQGFCRAIPTSTCPSCTSPAMPCCQPRKEA